MTVNLAAVAAARSELRAIVARWPELSTPAAHARLAGALPEVLMSRPIDQSRQSIQVGVRLSPDMATAVDREVERLQGAALGATIGRSDAIRGIILRWMADQRAPAPLVEPVVSAPAPQAPRARAVNVPLPPDDDDPIPSELVWGRGEGCDQCGKPSLPSPCLTPGCTAVVSVCGCEATLARDGHCEAHAPKASPAVAPLVLAPPPAAVDENSLRAKLRRLQASEDGTSMKTRRWSNAKIAAAVGLKSEVNVRRWLSGKNIEAPALASLAAYLRALPEV